MNDNITNQQMNQDHDTLIRIETMLTVVQADVKEVKNGTATKLAQLDSRVKVIEDDHTRIGGVQAANKRIIDTELWIRDFKVTWKTILFITSASSAAITFSLGVIAYLLGFIKK